MMLCPDMARTKEFLAGGSFFDNFGGVLKELVARALGSAAATGQMRILARSAARTGLVARGMATVALGSLSSSLGSRLKTVIGHGSSRARPHPVVSQPGAFPIVDLAVADPIADILGAPAFRECVQFFAANEAIERALVSPVTQALLFTLVRNIRPEHVIEIGTYKASTTEAICRALCANNRGIIHTVDPYGAGMVFDTLRKWPALLRRHICFYPTDSMDFYDLARHDDIRADVVFVDGNHDYEFALFDIESAARLIRPGGFIIIDNISQAGPYFAARDFLRNHPRWCECGHCIDNYRPEFPFDPHRTTIINTDACALRAPTNYFVGDRPTTRGQQIVTASKIDGISLAVAQPATGTLYLQCVVRVFDTPPTEATIENTVTMSGTHGATRVPLQWKFDPKDVQFARTAELWLAWQGDRELELAEEPNLF